MDQDIDTTEAITIIIEPIIMEEAITMAEITILELLPMLTKTQVGLQNHSLLSKRFKVMLRGAHLL